jgi:elongation factor G
LNCELRSGTHGGQGKTGLPADEAEAKELCGAFKRCVKVEVQAPEEFQGTVVGQLNQRRGTILTTESAEGQFTATANVPLNAMFGYSTDLRSATQGKGEFTMEFAKYAQVPKPEQEVMMKNYRDRLAAEKK